MKSERKEVHSIISRCAPLGWEAAREVLLLPVADTFDETEEGTRHRRVERSASIVRRIGNLAPPSGAARVIIVGSIRSESLRQTGDYRAISYVDSCHQLKQSLPPVLRQCGLDWLTVKTKLLEHYHHYQTGQINQWLQQFRKLRHEWIGEALLQLVDFWPSSRIGDALFEFKGTHGGTASNRHWMDSHDFVTYNDPSKGKSGAMISGQEIA
ncbi:MAG: hypothetical protein MN733_01215 [Nitrososphaera sp.]|nr:hypothetical protein [Nitrososphaera sp.]